MDISTERSFGHDRRAAMAILARADRQELAAAWGALKIQPDVTVLRPAEIGLVMARGRIGGGGAPFNVGEVTVTRTAVRIATGEVGVAYLLGRAIERAELAARFDALWQSPRYRDEVEDTVLARVAARAAAEDDLIRRKTAATRVNFFTLVRGEDP